MEKDTNRKNLKDLITAQADKIDVAAMKDKASDLKDSAVFMAQQGKDALGAGQSVPFLYG